jgi:branched-chain amino acid transport system permease protein
VIPGRFPSRLVLLVCLALALGSIPLWAPRFWIYIATQALIFAIFAMSLDLLVGYAGLPSFGHAAF